MIIHRKANSELKKIRLISKRTRLPSEKSSNPLSIAGLVTSILLISATVLLTMMVNNSFAQGNNNNASSPTSSNTNKGTTTTGGGGKLNCSDIAAKIAGVSIPNPSGICDVLILRQSPTIKGPGNMNMNKFSVINSIVEVATMSDITTKPGSVGGGGGGSSSSQQVFVMGEFGLLEPQLVPMVKAAVNSNWTIVAIHNHMLQEKPKMIFVHWSAQGDLNTIENQIKNVLLAVSKVPSSSTGSSGGGSNSSA
jgi:hypothetical protein